jgi:hypothetical protein
MSAITKGESAAGFQEIAARFEPPLVVISTHVGRGMYYLGEAVCEQLPPGQKAVHFPVEHFLPPRAVQEDVKRYKFIAAYAPWLLYIAYKTPFVYYRKYLREKIGDGADLLALKEKIEAQGARTVICISHRAAFWVSCLKEKLGLQAAVWDLLGEYGNNPGYQYLFWSQIEGFLSPLPREQLKLRLPARTAFVRIQLPARKAFYELAARPGSRDNLVLICGYWGQGAPGGTLCELRREFPRLKIHVVCGENKRLYDQISALSASAYGVVEDFASLLSEAGAVITKPGISTLLEAHAAGRKIFLVKGMPVAEDNNARYAAAHFGAEWFSMEGFRRWYGG